MDTGTIILIGYIGSYLYNKKVGLLSAALLVLGDDMAPLSLRVDLARKPLKRLRKLYRRSQTPPYADWLDVVPTRNAPHRSPKG